MLQSRYLQVSLYLLYLVYFKLKYCESRIAGQIPNLQTSFRLFSKPIHFQIQTMHYATTYNFEAQMLCYLERTEYRNPINNTRSIA